MRFRSIAIRLVLIIAALATVATSPPMPYLLSDSTTLDLTGPVTIRAYARANTIAFDNADELRLELRINAVEPGQAVLLVPDDPSQPIIEAVLDDGFWFHDIAVLAGEPCPREVAGGCELGVSIEVPEGNVVQVEVLGQATRFADPSFFFPDDRQFPAGAAVEVGIDE